MQHSSYRQRPPSLQPTSGSGSAPAPATIAHRPAGRRYSLWRDIYWGAVWGDFSPSIGIPGAVVQALIGYVPVLGTITALRDAVADVRQHDHAGLILNLLAAFPVLGGLAKTADVLHELRRLHRVYASHQDSQQDSQQQNETTADVGKRTGLGCLGFTISIVVLVLSMAYGWGIHIAAQSAAT